MLLLLPLPFLALHLIVLQPFHSSSYRVTFWLSPCLLSKLHRWPYLPETNYFCPMQTIHSKTSRDNFSKLFSYLHQWLLKNIMVPFYGWGSTTSRLRSIYEEGICFLPFPEIPSPSSLPVNPKSSAIIFMHCSQIIFWLVLSSLFAVLNTSHLSLSLSKTFPNLFLSFVYLAW